MSSFSPASEDGNGPEPFQNNKQEADLLTARRGAERLLPSGGCGLPDWWTAALIESSLLLSLSIRLTALLLSLWLTANAASAGLFWTDSRPEHSRKPELSALNWNQAVNLHLSPVNVWPLTRLMSRKSSAENAERLESRRHFCCDAENSNKLWRNQNQNQN